MEHEDRNSRLPNGRFPNRRILQALGVGGWILGSVASVTVAAVAAAAAGVARPPQQTPAAPPPQQPSEIAVVISGDPGTPPRYAVPDFVALSPAAAETAKTIGQVLWDDLDFE